MKMLFSIGAYHLFSAMNEEKHHVILEQLRVARDASLFKNPPEVIAQHFYQAAEEAVKKFDSRNGTDEYAKMLHLLDDKF